MSRIPRIGSKPAMKSSNTVTSKTPSGGQKTITTTTIRELGPVESQTGGDGGAPCGTCPANQTGGRSMNARPPSNVSGRPGGSGLRPPSGASGMRQPSARPPPSSQRPARRPPAPAPAPQMRPPMPGQYNVPAAYGPMSRQGKGMVYSSPEPLRGKMESRLPKDLKYEGIKMGREGGVRDRSALPGTTMADTFSGCYNVYGGGPMPQQEMGDRSVMDDRTDMVKVEYCAGVSWSSKSAFVWPR